VRLGVQSGVGRSMWWVRRGGTGIAVTLRGTKVGGEVWAWWVWRVVAEEHA